MEATRDPTSDWGGNGGAGTTGLAVSVGVMLGDGEGWGLSVGESDGDTVLVGAKLGLLLSVGLALG